jgi:hypothetical protein
MLLIVGVSVLLLLFLRSAHSRQVPFFSWLFLNAFCHHPWFMAFFILCVTATCGLVDEMFYERNREYDRTDKGVSFLFVILLISLLGTGLTLVEVYTFKKIKNVFKNL